MAEDRTTIGKLLHIAFRDIGMLAILFFVVWVPAAGYFHLRVRTAENAIKDYLQLLSSSPTKDQVQSFYNKYRRYERNGFITIESPHVPLLPWPEDDNNPFISAPGDCKEPSLNDPLIEVLSRKAILAFANSAGFTCYSLHIQFAFGENGNTLGHLYYLPLNGSRFFVTKYSTVQGELHPGWPNYQICKVVYMKPFIPGVSIDPDTPPATAAEITRINTGCLKRLPGCSFEEFLPGASIHGERDRERKIKSCHIGDSP